MRKHNRLLLLTTLLLTVFMLWGCKAEQQPTPTIGSNPNVPNPSIQTSLTVDFIDVGAADCILIRIGDKAMLIDGGDIGTEQVVLDYLKQQKITKFDYVVATHPHADHIGGLPDVLENYPTGLVIMPQKVNTTQIYSRLLDAIKNKNIPINVQPKQGTEYQLGEAKFTVLGPIKEYEDFNNNSIVLKLTYGEVDLLFTGDIERQAESDLLETGVDLQAEVLKVAHHGSDSSSITSFLKAVAPKYGIISVGEKYGNPHQDTIDALTNLGVEIHTTKLEGSITLATDGKDISIKAAGKSQADLPEQKVEDKVESRYVGNINSKKLHRESCDGLPKEENRKYFTSREDAISEGYTPCKTCNP